ncbi:MAG TPA: neutral zinc metallopeptidase [Solirubrobacteraceae bacterium]|jgi:hypothetical protein
MPAVRRILLAAFCVLLLAGCGTEDTDRLRERARERVERVRDQAHELRARAEKVSERLAARVRKVLDDLEKAVPEAGPQTRTPTARGRTEATTIEGYLTDILQSVDAYWTKTLTAAGRPEPRVSYVWVPEDARLRTGCGAVADNAAAFYCPADDTIYVGQVLAAQVYQGATQGFPGEQAGYGRAVGDFGVAYLVAHEYAHNLQHEFGTFDSPQRGSSKPFELQADCMAGLWGNSVYRAGKLQPGDIEEAMDTALAVGDFDYTNANHHGTPEERRAAWLAGFEQGDPADCRGFVPV